MPNVRRSITLVKIPTFSRAWRRIRWAGNRPPRKRQPQREPQRQPQRQSQRQSQREPQREPERQSQRERPHRLRLAQRRLGRTARVSLGAGRRDRGRSGDRLHKRGGGHMGRAASCGWPLLVLHRSDPPAGLLGRVPISSGYKKNPLSRKRERGWGEGERLSRP